uniref:HAT C-terminal dimerisation domain-containing protein n=1 Tax=Solanum lycopersicum TaxID=4081 RepID=A0A3Q7G2T4_SOLLC
MARDVLAIPVLSVASECDFSTGGSILDSFRISLTPIFVQALILLNLEKNFALMTCKIGGRKISSCIDHLFGITMKNLKNMKMDRGGVDSLITQKDVESCFDDAPKFHNG